MIECFLIYMLISFIYVGTSGYFEYLKLKETLKRPHYEPVNYILKLVLHSVAKTERGRSIKNRVVPYLIIAVILGAIIYSPAAFPGTIFRHIKKLLGVQTKSDKKLKQEEQELIRAHEESQEFMKKEGLGPPIE